SEPERGFDFMAEFWDEADDDVNRDGIQVLNATLQNLGESDRFRDIFKNFVVANYAKQLSGPSVPSHYKYVDETQPPGPYDDVNLHLSEDLGPTEQIGPVLSDVRRWGALYHEVRPDPLVPYLQVDYQVDSPHPAFFCLLAIKGDDIVYEERHEGYSFEKSLANDAFEKIAVIVAGLEQDVNFRYSINGTNPILRILDPLTGRKARVGDKNTPEKFVAKLEVLDPDSNPIEGINPTAFNFQIGPQSVPAGNIVTNAYVQGQYWFVIQAPTQENNISYDLVASWSILSDTETNSVQYQPRADADNVLVIDKSGSMSIPPSKIEDAKDAAELYVDSWREGDKIGVVSFNCNASPADMLLAPWNAGSRQTALNTIDGLSAGGGTSIGNGLKVGLNELVDRGDSNHAWAMILLSDGVNTCDPTIQDFLDENYDPREDANLQVPEIHTVAIGADANRPDLQSLANKTGGTYHFAAEPPTGPKGLADEFYLNIAEIYRMVSERVAHQHQILSWRDTMRRTQDNDHAFIVDGGASELIATARFQPGSLPPKVVLRDPMGATHEVTNQTSGHVVFRVGAPMPGQWKLELRCITGIVGGCLGASYLVEASIKSSLTMDLFFGLEPEERIAGTPMPILVSLTDTGPITGAIVGIFTTSPSGVVIPQFLWDDGNHGDGAANDGIYGNTYHWTSEPGTYQVQAAAIGTSDLYGDFFRRITEAFHMEGDDDGDHDGMPDRYERRVGLNPEIDDSDDDPDNDGLPSGLECEIGTNPFDPDTDDGGEQDGSEHFAGRNPHYTPDDLMRAPWIMAEPGVQKVFVRYNLPVLAANPSVTPVTYTLELSRAVGQQSEFQVHVPNIQVVSPTFEYMDTDVMNGVPYKYRMVAVGPNNERSAPSNIAMVTPTLDPYPPVGMIMINDGAPTTSSLMADLSIYAMDGYDPEYNFPDRDEFDLMAETTGVARMMISNKSDGSDGKWEPYQTAKNDWMLQPNKMGIATVFAKFRDGAGSESVVYHSSIKVVESPTPTPTDTSTITPTPTETSTPGTPTATPTVCDVGDEDYDLDGNRQVDARDLLMLLEAIAAGEQIPDFNCDSLCNELDLFLMAEKWGIEFQR
ncbi:MAG: VWA domain-containing protein, partial [Candidatus Omnitrophica bacterium]|nr:VWA domain-containing protein [Candidatus Omnitrophota bacterium]